MRDEFESMSACFFLFSLFSTLIRSAFRSPLHHPHNQITKFGNPSSNTNPLITHIHHSPNKHPIAISLLKPGAEGRRHRQQVLHLFALLHRLHNPSIHILLPLLQRRQIHVRRQSKASLHKRIHIARREVPRLPHHHRLQQQPHIIPLENLRVHLQHFLVPLKRLRLIAPFAPPTKAYALVASWKLPSS